MPNTEVLARRIAEIRTRFLEALPQRLVEIDALAAGLMPLPADGAESDREGTVALHRIIHNVAGIAATLGLPELGRQALAIDRALAPAAREGEALTEADIEAVRTAAAALRASADLQLSPSDPSRMS